MPTFATGAIGQPPVGGDALVGLAGERAGHDPAAGLGLGAEHGRAGDAHVPDGARWLQALRRIAMALMARIHSNYRFVIGFNGALIALGVAGVLPPATSATLHNLSTLGVSLRSMSRLALLKM